MERGDFFIIGGKWVASSSHIMIYANDPDDRRILEEPASCGDKGIILQNLSSNTKYFMFFKNFYHVLFEDCKTGLVHRDFLVKLE